MPAGRATTFSVENHEGVLYNTSPMDTKFFSMLGGLFGGESVNSIVLPWQEYSLRDASSERQRIEAADHPASTHVTRAPIHNVLEIRHESIDTSWTKRATQAQLAAIGSAHPAIATAGADNPVGDEHPWQQSQQLKEVVRDIELTLFQGDFVEPADINSARQTRGIIAATETNVVDLGSDATNVTGEDADDLIDATAHPFADDDKVQFTALTGGSGLETGRSYYVVTAAANTFQLANSLGGAPVSFGSDITATTTIEKVADATEDDILGLLQLSWDNGGIQEEETAVVFVNSWGKRALTDIFITQKGYQETSRKIAGVSVTTILTEFGTLNVVMDRFLPKNMIQVVSMEECNLAYLVLDSGEKVRVRDVDSGGSRDRTILYFEWGLVYGNELKHANLSGLATR